MDRTIKDALQRDILSFDLPPYREIPNVGLFLEQTVKYISEYLAPLDDSVNLTGSMISNYVKKGIIKNPVKKQYAREQIAYLFYIAIAKSVLSLEDIQTMLQLQTATYDIEEAYEYFRSELKNILRLIFEMQDALEPYTQKNSDEKALLRNTIITAAHKIYLDKYFRYIRTN